MGAMRDCGRVRTYALQSKPQAKAPGEAPPGRVRPGACEQPAAEWAPKVVKLLGLVFVAQVVLEGLAVLARHDDRGGVGGLDGEEWVSRTNG